MHDAAMNVKYCFTRLLYTTNSGNKPDTHLGKLNLEEAAQEKAAQEEAADKEEKWRLAEFEKLSEEDKQYYKHRERLEQLEGFSMTPCHSLCVAEEDESRATRRRDTTEKSAGL